MRWSRASDDDEADLARWRAPLTAWPTYIVAFDDHGTKRETKDGRDGEGGIGMMYTRSKLETG